MVSKAIRRVARQGWSFNYVAAVLSARMLHMELRDAVKKGDRLRIL